MLSNHWSNLRDPNLPGRNPASEWYINGQLLGADSVVRRHPNYVPGQSLGNANYSYGGWGAGYPRTYG